MDPTQTADISTLITIKIKIDPTSLPAFFEWQSRLNACIADFPGFISLEILSPTTNQWIITEQFKNSAAISGWQQSDLHIHLMQELTEFQVNGKENLAVSKSSSGELKKGITEVFVTQVHPDKIELYKNWIGRIHLEQTKSPGFIGAYLQSPTHNQGKNWITFLQFDTPENLDNWLESPKRLKLLKESEALIESLDAHRVVSPYAGWFSTVSHGIEAPAVWKQTMIILLVLFPIVMLQLRFLSPLLQDHFNLTLITFISNAISVSLLSWPLVPLAIRFLDWWLNPSPINRAKINVQGTLIVLGLYLVEIILLWNLF